MRLSILFILAYSTMFGQTTGNIKGKILSERNGVPYANVGIGGTTFGSSSDEQGNFKINNIPTGKYTLQASAIGFKNYKKTVEIKPNETISIQLEL